MYDPQPHPYILDTGDRIAERNTRAAEVIAKKQGFDKTKAQVGLWWANTSDRVGSWFSNPDAELANGIFSGLVRGLATGILLYGLLSLAWSVPILLVPASALLLGAIDGYDAYKLSRAHDGRIEVGANADKIALSAGALEQVRVPEQDVVRRADEIHRKNKEEGGTGYSREKNNRIGDAPLRDPPTNPRQDLPAAYQSQPERGKFTKAFLDSRAARHPEERGLH